MIFEPRVRTEKRVALRAVLHEPTVYAEKVTGAGYYNLPVWTDVIVLPLFNLLINPLVISPHAPPVFWHERNGSTDASGPEFRNIEPQILCFT